LRDRRTEQFGEQLVGDWLAPTFRVGDLGLCRSFDVATRVYYMYAVGQVDLA